MKATVITNQLGHLPKMIVVPGSVRDFSTLKVLDPKYLTKKSTLYGDTKCNHYNYEDRIKEEGVKGSYCEKKNATKPYELEDYVNLKASFKMIEVSSL